MPRILVNESSYPEPFMFAIDRAVGRGAPNDRLDVLLVQYMLRAFTGERSPYQPPVAAPGVRAVVPVAPPAIPPGPTPAGIPLPGGSPIAIDGVCGNQTIAFIEAFQQLAIAHFYISHVDGIVGPVGSASDGTLVALNMAFIQARPTQTLASLFRRDALFPAELTPILYNTVRPNPWLHF